MQTNHRTHKSVLQSRFAVVGTATVVLLGALLAPATAMSDSLSDPSPVITWGQDSLPIPDMEPVEGIDATNPGSESASVEPGSIDPDMADQQPSAQFADLLSDEEPEPPPPPVEATAAPSVRAAWVLVVDSLGSEPAAGSLTDGVCRTAAGTCTLRAAIQEANALNRPRGEIEIRTAPGLTGNIAVSSAIPSTWMRTRPLAVQTGYPTGTLPGEDGAIYAVTAPVVIDLGGLNVFDPAVETANTTPALAPAVFFLNGSDITIRNGGDVYGFATSFYIGPKAKSVTIREVTTAAPNGWPQRFYLVRGGATSVTILANEVSGFAASGRAGNWGVIDATSASFPVAGLWVNSNIFTAPPTPQTACSGLAGGGCASTPLDAPGQHFTTVAFLKNRVVGTGNNKTAAARWVNLAGVEADWVHVQDNLFDDATFHIDGSNTTALLDLSEARVYQSITFKGNRIRGLTSEGSAPAAGTGLVHLPGVGHTRNIFVTANTFGTTSPIPAAAIYLHQALDLQIGEQVSIVGNHFDALQPPTGATIHLSGPIIANVARNTFAPNSGSQADTINEEVREVGPLLVGNTGGANPGLDPWHPTGTSSLVADTTCQVSLTVAPPPGFAMPPPTGMAHRPALTVGVYWTGSDTAEVNLGEHPISTATPTTLSVALPAPGHWRLDPNRGIGPIDPDTGAVTGALRVQTHTRPPSEYSALVSSSQYSRTIAITGACDPAPVTPAMTITKEAFIHVADPSTAQSTRATGTKAPPGVNLPVGAVVCFIYTATNTTEATGAQYLSDVYVHDSDRRLGYRDDPGYIFGLKNRPPGDSWSAVACTELIPQDTTVGRWP